MVLLFFNRGHNTCYCYFLIGGTIHCLLFMIIGHDTWCCHFLVGSITHGIVIFE